MTAPRLWRQRARQAAQRLAHALLGAQSTRRAAMTAPPTSGPHIQAAYRGRKGDGDKGDRLRQVLKNLVAFCRWQPSRHVATFVAFCRFLSLLRGRERAL